MNYRNNKLLLFLRSALRLLRAQTYLIIGIQLLISIAVVSNTSGTSFSSMILQHFVNFVLCWLSIAFWYIHATALNDLADFEIDKINLSKDKDRPLIMGEASKGSITAIAITAGMVGLTTTLLINKSTALLMLVMLALNWAYSMPPIRISYRGGLAQLLLPLGYVVFPFLLGIVAFDGDLYQQTIIILVGLYLLFSSRVLLKDFRDVKGDRKHGKLTFLLRHSTATVAKTAIITYVLGIIIFIVEILEIGFAILLVPLVFIAGIVLVLFNELAVTNSWREQKPLLAPIGRLITAQSLLLLLALISQTESLTTIQVIMIATAITASMIWSSYISLTQNVSRKQST